eukprot:TRINITY_DN3059_c0_g1_i1.p1 TRINITY_DN3059_c0_g1~~TRINITY_DN3059_c0_g1_i1.p1  ORF type:complete len:237 (+),score=29.61 TRINITY_DN3059_c0_g1_i1:71-781(+)
MTTVQQWFQSLPPVTKTCLCAIGAISALASFKVLPVIYLYFDLTLIFGHFQIWRILSSCLFLGTFSMPFIFQCYFFVHYTSQLENILRVANGSTPYKGSAQLCFIMLFGIVCFQVISAFLFPSPFFASQLVFMLIYVWSRRDPFQPVSFFGFAFQSWHVPFVLIVFSILMGSSILEDIIAVLVGHLYVFFADIIPNAYHVQLLQTPDFLNRLFEKIERPSAAPRTYGPGYSLSHNN